MVQNGFNFREIQKNSNEITRLLCENQTWQRCLLQSAPRSISSVFPLGQKSVYWHTSIWYKVAIFHYLSRIAFQCGLILSMALSHQYFNKRFPWWLAPGGQQNNEASLRKQSMNLSEGHPHLFTHSCWAEAFKISQQQKTRKAGPAGMF